MRKFHYNGDVNIEYGGTYYALDTFRDGYVDAVRVIPCSCAGGPDNAFWLEALTVLIPKPGDQRLKSALDCIGADEAGMRGNLARGQVRHTIVDAMLAYGRYDPANCFPDSGQETIQIGKALDDAREKVEVDIVLRGNTSLRRYVMRWLRNRFPG